MKKIAYLISLLVVICACNKAQETKLPVLENEEAAVATKVIIPSENYESSSFLVKFNAPPTAEELSHLKVDGVQAIEPVFPSFKGKEALEKEFGLDRWYEVSLEEGRNLEKAVSSMASFSEVDLVEYNSIARKMYEGDIYPAEEPLATRAAAGTFNDPMLLDQWHYNNQGSSAYSKVVAKGADINVKDVWNRLTCGDPDIIVAVVDEGVKYNHPDLKDNMWVNTKEIPGNGVDDDGNGYIDDVYGYNFVTGGDISWTDFTISNGRVYGDVGHGTHCAGTISAVNNNNRGVAGVAGGSGSKDGVKIMSCQIFSGFASGSGSGSVTARAIKYAADMGASIISCSYGYTNAFTSDNNYMKGAGTAEIDAIHYFEASKNNSVLDGNLAIFAAGNDSHNYAHYPGAFVDIISVSAFAPDFLPAYYTNYGPGCNISAPGGEYYHGVGEKSCVLSTLPTEIYESDYGYMQGTSMACPHVSGVVALALSYAKQLGKTFSRDQFKRMILSSVNDIDQRIASNENKKTDKPFALAPYYHQMGTGAIDAWRLMMKIEGTPTSTAHIGEKQWIDLTATFGTASVSLTYLNVDVPQATVDALGLQKIQGTNNKNYPSTPEGESYAYVQFGRLYIHPTKIGSGKIAITAVGGGDHVGGGDNPPGGMEMEQDISIIVRDVDGGNGTGGWL